MILSSENEKQKALATSCYLRSSANLLVVVAILRGVVLDGQAATGLNATDLRRKDRPDTGTGRLRRGVR